MTLHANRFMRRLAVACLLQPAVACAWAQDGLHTDPYGLRTHSTMAGGGLANILDTYLSPYSYTGEHAAFIYETDRPLHRWSKDSISPRLHLRQSICLDGSHVQNPARNTTEWAGGIDYSAAWLYTLTHRPLSGRLTLEAGPMAEAYAGGIYNEHDGNNPAQAKASVTLNAALRASLRFRLLRREALARYTLSVPLLGMAFSPAYGQSYYEAFGLGHYDHNIVLAHPANMPSMRHLLSVDLPLRPSRSATCIRLGYAADIMQSRFNGLRYHAYSHTFLIGVTRTFRRL